MTLRDWWKSKKYWIKGFSPKYCQKCILPLNIIPHNKQRECIYCEKYGDNESPWNAGEKLFEKTVKEYLGKGFKYDVVCPITGGKDSVFALNRILQYVPANRVLAFTWDHGFHRDGAWENMRKAIKITGVRHEVLRIGDSLKNTIKVTHEFHKKFGSPCFACVMQQTMFVLWSAFKYEVPLIVFGATPGQQRLFEQGPAVKISEQQGMASVNKIKEMIAGEKDKVFEKILMASLSAEEARKAYEKYEKPFRSRGIKGFPDVMSMGFFFDWNKNEKEVVQILHDSLGFIKPEITLTHTSCELTQLRGYRECIIGNFISLNKQTHWKKSPGAMESEIARIIRSGGASRQRGFEELELLGISSKLPREAINLYLKKTGITQQEFNEFAEWNKK